MGEGISGTDGGDGAQDDRQAGDEKAVPVGTEKDVVQGEIGPDPLVARPEGMDEFVGPDVVVNAIDPRFHRIHHDEEDRKDHPQAHEEQERVPAGGAPGNAAATGDCNGLLMLRGARSWMEEFG